VSFVGMGLGLGLGIPLLVLLGGLLGYCLRKKRAAVLEPTRQTQQPQGVEVAVNWQGKPELDSQNIRAEQPRAEMGDREGRGVREVYEVQ
jgi:hypothetical protein